MAELLLGPLLRHVGTHDVTVWVETDAPCEVEVRSATARATERTFAVAGHHYAIVVVDGLPAGTCEAYTVRLDGEQVWPLAESAYPPSVLRTVDASRPFHVLFGSCRSPAAVVVKDPTGSGEDVLAGYARRMVRHDPETWPQALFMLGDQVYADEPSEPTRDWLAARRDLTKAPHEQVANFEEYTHLYHEAWGDPDVRWLLSVLPSSMIFDDHDVLDDWNTSRAWRDEMQATSWWEERITGALSSYWVYQHLGNLSPAGLAADETYRRVRAETDGEAVLRAFAQAADREADGARGALWSFRRDLGRVRLLIIDSRAGRILLGDKRLMVGEAEFAWIEEQVADRDYDHLVIGTSVPWLLPRALHDVESANERLCDGSRGRLVARVSEKVRRAVDLEHWAAFDDSFERLARLIGRVGSGEDGAPAPATICVLSGDVHHTYVSEAAYPHPMEARVFQLTCSPMHNGIPLAMRGVFKLAWGRFASRLTRFLVRFARATPASIDWTTTGGPYFGNHVGSLRFSGRTAEFTLSKSEREGEVTYAVPVPEAARDLTHGSRPQGLAAETAR
ncbi:MAG TPA: alkaline phosphatase D family protein [Candidatus Limnocylindrales bacterium]|nr:alkaline phosphatase D family protein [Candidatus Limnocylindrales bacterium]